MTIFKVPPLNQSIFNTTLEVRISDINYGNHLGHDSLISLLHEARIRFLNHHAYSELNIEGLGILVTNLAVNYLGEAFYGDTLTINIGIDDISRASLDLVYHVVENRKNKDIAKALTTITFYDYQNRKVARIPPAFLSRITSRMSQS